MFRFRLDQLQYLTLLPQNVKFRPKITISSQNAESESPSRPISDSTKAIHPLENLTQGEQLSSRMQYDDVITDQNGGLTPF